MQKLYSNKCDVIKKERDHIHDILFKNSCEKDQSKKICYTFASKHGLIPASKFTSISSALRYTKKLKKMFISHARRQRVSITELDVLANLTISFMKGHLVREFCVFCDNDVQKWPDEAEVSFETMRCIFDTKFMRDLKLALCSNGNNGIYSRVFKELYADILPDSKIDSIDHDAENDAICWKDL